MTQDTAFEIVRFGRFTLDARRRTLLADGHAVALHARAFDVLAFLIANRDRAVPQAEILAHVWENRIVGENNLAVQLSSLRKALTAAGAAEPLIVTHSGQRYQFVGDIQEADTSAPAPDRMMGSVDAPSLVGRAPTSIPARQWRRPAFGMLGLLLVMITAAWMLWLPTPKPPHLSIAVLPFRNASPDRTQDYLADAISDDLRADLGHIPASVVIARESSEAVRRETPQRIGAALNVRYLLSGTLVPEGDSYHVVSTLTDAETGRQLWSAQFDPKRDRISDLRQDIVRLIASPLQIELDELESARSLHDRPDNPAAIDLFFRARSALHAGATLHSFQAAQDLLQEALRQQPDFVEASSELAWTLLLKVTLTDDPDDGVDFLKAKRLVAQALAMSTQNVKALAARAKSLQIDGDCAGARADAERVLAMEPSNLDVRSVLGGCDQDEFRLADAAIDYETMLRLDPANPNAGLRYTTLGTIRLVQGRYDDAVRLLTRVVDADSTPSADLEPAEQAELMLIAANDLARNREQARAAYDVYSHKFSNRTVWRISGYFRPSWRRSDGLWRA